jgi:thiamine-monophosphate kinase
MAEFELIRRLASRFGQFDRSVLQGIGDDAAVVHLDRQRVQLLTTDLLAEGIHFDRATASFDDIGFKGAVANLSDIAAMGGRPQHMLVALAIPPRFPSSAVDRLYRGIMQACRPHGVALIGGDISAARGDLFFSIAMTGIVPRSQLLTRSGARAGDDVYVTGTLGDSLAGLALIGRKSGRPSGRLRKLATADRQFLIARHLRPTPRLEIGRWLARHRLATAAIDLSDGLSGDLVHLCERSRVGIEVNRDALPMSPALLAYAALKGVDPTALALQGGEDYELLFTAPPRVRDRLEGTAGRLGCAVTRIGTIRAQLFGRRIRERNQSLTRMPRISYEHFARASRVPR